MSNSQVCRAPWAILLPKVDNCKQNAKPLRPGTERLTVEAAVSHLELLEVRECAPFGRDSASELVRVEITSADVEHLE